MDVRINAGTENEWISARSMEFGVNLMTQLWQRKGRGDWHISMNPSQNSKQPDEVSVISPSSKNQPIDNPEFSATWRGCYDFIHTNAMCANKEDGYTTANGYITSDGMNSEGLTIGSLYLPGMTYYLTPGQVREALDQDPHESFVIGSAFFPTWVLSRFSSVGELVDYLKEKPVYVVLNQLGEAGKTLVSMTLHYVIHDAHGHSAVIEFLYDRKMSIHRCYMKGSSMAAREEKPINPYLDNFKISVCNPAQGYQVLLDHGYVGVMTNSSDYIWHVNYLSQFSNLTNKVQQANKVDQESTIRESWSPGPLTAVNGSGLVGLPADPTPPSRFVQTYVCEQLATRPKNLDEALVLAEKLLNRVDIPRGLMVPDALKDNQELDSDITQWAVLRNPASRELYFRTYANMTWEKAICANIECDALLKQFSLTETPFKSAKVLTPCY
jgi:choloylglycine hydrolase